MLFSLSKSFTSTAIGLARRRGRLSVDDRVLDFFPDEAPANPDDRLRAMRVRHLLDDDHRPRPRARHHPSSRRPGRAATKSQAGRGPSWAAARARARHALRLQLARDLHALRDRQRLTGQRIVDYLQPRLFEPLGIAPPTWETSPRGDQHRRLGPEPDDSGHRPLRPALPPARGLAGQTPAPRGLGRARPRRARCRTGRARTRTGSRGTATSSGAAATTPTAATARSASSAS